MRTLSALSAAERRGLIRELETRSRALGFMYRRRAKAPAEAHPLALAPFVLPRSRASLIMDLSRAVLRLHQALPALYREGVPEVLMACPLERRSREWLAILPRESLAARLLIRIDVGWTAGFEPVLYETNATAVAGFVYHPAGVRLLREVVGPRLGLPPGLRAPPDLADMVYRWLVAAAGPKARVGFVEEPPFGPGDTEMPALAERLSRRGLRCAWGTPRQVRRHGGGFTLRGRPVDWLVRDLNLHELPEPGTPGLGAFEAMVRLGRVLPGPGAEFDHKGMLELLTSRKFEALFAREDVRLLRRCVPWTRVVYERRTDGPDGRAVDLLPFIERRPARWVLKPNRGCGGERVIMGADSPGAWRTAWRDARRRPGAWVVQERRDTVRLPMPVLSGGRLRRVDAYATVGVFCAGGRCGFYGRVNPRPVVNVARGGALAAVFIGAGRRKGALG